MGLGGGEREFARKPQGLLTFGAGSDMRVGQTILLLDDSSHKTLEFLWVGMAWIEIGEFPYILKRCFPKLRRTSLPDVEDSKQSGCDVVILLNTLS